MSETQEGDIPLDKRHHVQSMLMRESLLDKKVMSSTENSGRPYAALLPRPKDRRPLGHR